MQADEAVARAFLRQNDLELVLAQNRLDALAALREDPLIPVRLLQEARIKLDEVNDIADKVAAELTSTVKALAAQRAIFRTAGVRDAQRLELSDSLEVLGRFQQRDLTALHARLQTERQAYARLIGERSARSLLEQRSLPLSGADSRRVAATAGQLPHLSAAAVRDLIEVTAGRARAASAGHWVAAVLGSPVLALRPARRALCADPGDRLALTRTALARVLPALLPAALWLVAGLALALPPTIRLPVLLVLLLWPLQVFVLDLSRRAVAARVEADPGGAAALPAPAQARRDPSRAGDGALSPVARAAGGADPGGPAGPAGDAQALGLERRATPGCRAWPPADWRPAPGATGARPLTPSQPLSSSPARPITGTLAVSPERTRDAMRRPWPLA